MILGLTLNYVGINAVKNVVLVAVLNGVFSSAANCAGCTSNQHKESDGEPRQSAGTEMAWMGPPQLIMAAAAFGMLVTA
jgi:hypothetical protein